MKIRVLKIVDQRYLRTRMRVQHFLALLLCLFVNSVWALDETDVGTYAVIHKDGHTTDQVFRFTQTKKLWRMKDRKTDGTWKPIECDRPQDCVMYGADAYSLKKYFTEADIVKLAPSCAETPTFAFCSYLKDDAGVQRQYALRLLVTPGPVEVKLVRVPN
jgi:hypothetical protein